MILDIVIVFENGIYCNGSFGNSLLVGFYKIKFFKCFFDGKFLYVKLIEWWKIIWGKVSIKGFVFVLFFNNFILLFGI